ncbi:hypothetical protein EEL42_11605 [Muribaculaceae bacterium Isolate-100 (HZI)]|nr:hypothetical protein EEL42_11605 [Muribaculaceae bacterium Isolate-100 (HZI)]
MSSPLAEAFFLWTILTVVMKHPLNDYDEDRDMDNDNDEPMNDEEWAAFVQRSMERGKDSRSLDCGDLIAG